QPREFAPGEPARFPACLRRERDGVASASDLLLLVGLRPVMQPIWTAIRRPRIVLLIDGPVRLLIHSGRSMRSARPNTTRRPGRPKVPGLELRRRTEILDAAATQFARNGFAATDVQVIADQLGIGKGTVYRYFRT